MQLKHIMIDCESFGLKQNSIITTIGAVEFDPYSDRLGATFHQAIDPVDAQRSGLTIDAGTVLWWLAQKRVAQDLLVHKLTDAMSLNAVLYMFNAYVTRIGSKKEIKVWTCGHMDLCWLQSAHEAVGRGVPYNYRVGDYRTIRDEFGLPSDEPEVGTAHDALSDAIYQARFLQNIYARLGKTA